MWFIVAGVLLIGLKLAEFGPFGAWSWWLVLAPFALAAVWWAYADATGLTRRREMDKLEERKHERRRKNMEALGIDKGRQKKGEVATRVRSMAAERAEAARTEARAKNEATIRRSTGFGDLPDNSKLDDKP